MRISLKEIAKFLNFSKNDFPQKFYQYANSTSKRAKCAAQDCTFFKGWQYNLACEKQGLLYQLYIVFDNFDPFSISVMVMNETGAFDSNLQLFEKMVRSTSGHGQLG